MKWGRRGTSDHIPVSLQMWDTLSRKETVMDFSRMTGRALGILQSQGPSAAAVVRRGRGAVQPSGSDKWPDGLAKESSWSLSLVELICLFAKVCYVIFLLEFHQCRSHTTFNSQTEHQLVLCTCVEQMNISVVGTSYYSGELFIILQKYKFHPYYLIKNIVM